MRNLLILGSGRSGSSMVAGAFRTAPYFMGENLWEASDSNPKGYFEDYEINSINEEILTSVVRLRPRILGWSFCRDRPRRGQMWLARIPLDAKISCPPEITQRIIQLTSREPFCFKDPRFAYTLPCWAPHLVNTRHIVVFRDPATTVASLEKECRKDYLHDLSITRDEIIELWMLTYSHILRWYRCGDSWLFIHYDQVLQPAGLDRLEKFSAARVDRLFPDVSLRRSSPINSIPPRAKALYSQLCDLADYDEGVQ